ncbi:aspartate aminotransferase family protein [uncultured Imperialibacter sp.]|uniref:aspartate aminotransferase family protein n=1 Tax=uncultured Imperialibacter sp. TaxID=1672639 RepID=UPI0030DA9DBD|tara:strand:+ start:2326 stop:3546 length:1221 start_codon:yes stop_codon:yes gene_type:complete
MSIYNNQQLHDIDKQHYLPTFGRFPITFERGKGAKLWDTDGKEYVDMLAGIAVCNVGHCHPTVVKALREQAGKLMHISNFFLSEPQALLAKKLSEISGMDRVFFSNSGAESAEGAIKIARKYGHSKGKGGTVISMKNCFHGRTLATIATGKKTMQDGFEPIPQGFMQVPFNNIDALKKALQDNNPKGGTHQISAIIVEPIQGEGGINVADLEFLKALRQLCDDEEIVLIFDEIQSGIGRTGKWFAKDHFGVQPDIMTLAKGLGGGIPIGAILCSEKMASVMKPGDHGTTFGGNPLVCATSLAVLEVIEEENLLTAAKEKGAWLKKALLDMNEPSLKEVRGKGLMLGAEFDFETKPLVVEMLKNGVVANATAGNVLRFVPALTIGYDEMEQAITVLKESLINIKAHA